MATQMTHAENEAVQRHLTKYFNEGNGRCPVCAGTNLDILGVEVAANLVGTEARFTGTVIPTIAVMCATCFYVLHFAWKPIVDPVPPK